jgi:hypothetical protein
MAAGPFVNNKNIVFNKSVYIQNETGNVKVVFRNKGRMDAQNVKVEFIPLSGYVTIPVQVYTKAAMPSFTSDSVTFNFTISGSCPNNYAIPTRIRIKQNDTNIVYNQVYNLLLGNGFTKLADSAENGTSNWTFGTGWGLNTTYYHTPTHSFAYPNYGNNVNNAMSLSFPLNLSDNRVVFLEFWNRYDIESGYDYGIVEVSSNNGTNWSQVSRYTGTNTTWTKQVFDITDLTNMSSNFRIRFRLTSDGNTVGAGWFVDDIRIKNYQSPSLYIENNSGLVPSKYSLEQNYPNPFNPNTQINYGISKSGFVRITVFDLLGREISTLVNEVKSPGFYAVDFNASKLSSGIYFYRMESNGFVDTKKLTLIK